MKDGKVVCNLCGRDRFSVLEEAEKPIYVLKCV